MNDDLRKYNGGARQGAGRPKTVDSYRQIAVRLPEEMARWVLRQSMKMCGGCEAELLRRLIQAAMEQDKANEATKPQE
jgi:hypothetical protein